MKLFKTPTISEQQEKRANEVLITLQSTYDSRFKTKSFTELETVQILNMVRRKLNDKYDTEVSECLERSLNEQQKAKEIKEAIALLE